MRKRLSVFTKPETRESAVNPFVNLTTTPSFYEKAKLVLMAPVACVRIICGVGNILSLAAVCKLLTLGLSEKDLKEKPLSKTRYDILSWSIYIFGRSFLFCLGFHWIEVRGKPATTEEAPIVVCNHTCMIDPFILGHMLSTSAVGAREHLSTPILGVIFRAQQLITVDRKDPNSRHDVKKMIKQRAQPGSGWLAQTLIFPEATCTNGRALISFRGGPFAPGAPVQPVVVRFPHTHFDPCWVQGGPGMPMILYRLACQFHNYARVDFLTPHVPSSKEKSNPILYGNNVRQRMSEVMEVPCTWHGYDDVRLQMEAQKLHLPASIGVVGMQGIQEGKFFSITTTVLSFFSYFFFLFVSICDDIHVLTSSDTELYLSLLCSYFFCFFFRSVWSRHSSKHRVQTYGEICNNGYQPNWTY